jgi:hypothetical protein
MRVRHHELGGVRVSASPDVMLLVGGYDDAVGRQAHAREGEGDRIVKPSSTFQDAMQLKSAMSSMFPLANVAVVEGA